MRLRFVEERCHDCGRVAEKPGYCVTVEKKGWLFWTYLLIIHHFGGGWSPAHFPSVKAATEKVVETFAEMRRPKRVVVSEVEF